MSALGLSEVLTLTQTLAIIGALVLTLYFSRRQLQALKEDLETRVLNDLDEKFHRLGEIFIDKPDLVRVIYDGPEAQSPEVPLAYYVLFFCAHIFHMRQRGILSDNEWVGWLAWIKNTFRQGRMGKYWHESRMEAWVDPAFKEFITREVLDGSRGPPESSFPGGGSSGA
ncbi:MAG: hypothetical protein L3K10_04355 [Thermoplasmata archaeon]|nr:hypothetical protein [Thermoplasmata archaeon]